MDHDADVIRIVEGCGPALLSPVCDLVRRRCVMIASPKKYDGCDEENVSTYRHSPK
jgi:hypothetical protein